MKRHYILHTIYFLFICLVFAIPIHAQEYILELQQIEATDEAQLKPKIPSDRLNELEYQGYSVLNTNQNTTEFYFEIDKTAISFSSLDEGGIFIQPITITVTSEDGVGYQILTKMTASLSSISDQTIEQTSCDDGCTVRSARPWNSEDTYGWGYSIDDGQMYRPFSRASMVSIRPEHFSDTNLKMVLKVQTPQNQPEGNFQGNVQLIALPEL